MKEKSYDAFLSNSKNMFLERKGNGGRKMRSILAILRPTFGEGSLDNPRSLPLTVWSVEVYYTIQKKPKFDVSKILPKTT